MKQTDNIASPSFARRALYFLLFIAFVPLGILAQTATLTGRVQDASTQEPLAFATVALSGKALGTAVDIDGNFRLVNIPDGEHVVRVSYTGYQSVERTIVFAAGQTVTEIFELGESNTLKAVEVTAQAIGQQAAINQQIASNTIVNVISKEKLRELPDQNAAESLGRLSGVAVQRDAGEGQKVVIRGLSPRFASVTINGERIPSTDGDDRSVDLSMVSPDMLSGVELFKAIRPDMDGDAVGGTVNFTVKKADKGSKGDVRLFGGYNGLGQNIGPWRGSTTLSNRFLKNKLGLLFTGNFQRADRRSENLEGSYYFSDIVQDSAIIRAAAVTLTDQLETRDRYGASLTADYALPHGAIMLNSFWGNTERDVLRRRRSFRSAEGQQELSIREFEQNIRLLSNSLSGEHNLGKFIVNWRGSYSTTLQETPWSLDMRFRETAALTPDHDDANGPEKLVQGYKNNLNEMFLHDSRFSPQKVTDYNATSQVDLRYNFKITNQVSGYIKTGGKYRQNGRTRDNMQLLSQPYLAAENYPGQEPELFLLNSSKRAYLTNFMGDYNNSGFLEGNYSIFPDNNQQVVAIPENFNAATYNGFWNTNFAAGDSVRYTGHIDMDKVRAFYDRYKMQYDTFAEVDAEDYRGTEKIYASYLMGEFNFGTQLMLMGGIRFENTRQAYKSVSFALQDPEDGNTATQRPPVDTRAASGYMEWLPMLHLRYKFAKWADIRLAATKTLNRPDFFSLVPWEIISPQNPPRISRGRPDLKHTTAWNYDAFLYLYNTYGLFTIGGFYKELTNVDVQSRSTIIAGKYAGYQLNQPINLPGISKVRGIEVDFQSNLRSLPGFWKGIIVGANVTLVRSRTQVPFFEIKQTFDPNTPPFFFTEVTDTVRAGRVPGQANIIGNVQLGYEWKKFSGRVSMSYQDNSLARVGERPELDAFTDRSVRWDFASQYKVNRHWAVFFNLNNLSNQPEAAFVGRSGFFSEREYFGMTGEIGCRFQW